MGTSVKIGVLLILAEIVNILARVSLVFDLIVTAILLVGGYGLVTERPWGLKFGIIASLVGVVFACVEGILFYVFRFMFLELIGEMGVEMTEMLFLLMTLPFPVIVAILSVVALLLCVVEIRKE
ncbi:MAG: hypothetical protein ACTSYM_13925 [Candidatus Baldrarchaeia archaeon]